MTEAVMRPQIGQLINNKYRLMRIIGDGGMGSVFEARHEALGTSVALKFLHSELTRRQGLVQRFLQEARVSAKIQSVHVVRVTDVEQTQNGLPFIVMEYLDGKSLQTLYEDLYKAGKRLSYEEAIDYALQMLDGLEAAHEEGIVHRDLKPDNVMIVKGKRGEPIVKLLDFGIAKLKINGELYKGLTRPGVIMGTPEYMAPEQVFSADSVDARADIFSCGVIFFEMLAGRRPVGGDEPHQIAAQYLAGSGAKLTDLAPHVPAELAAIVHRAMSPDAKDRFASIHELREAMLPFASDPRASRSSDAGKSRLSPAPASPTAASLPPHVIAAGVSSLSQATPAAAMPAAAVTPGGVDGDRKPVNGTSLISRDAVRAAEAQIAANAAAHGQAMLNGPIPDETVESMPFFPGATEAYEPFVGPAGAPGDRPGGTSVGGAVGVLPTTEAYGSYNTANASYSNVAAAPRQGRRGGMGLVGILAIAGLLAGVAVGGVYAYDQLYRSDGDKKGKDTSGTIDIKSPATVNVASTTTPPTPTPQPQPQPQPTPTPTTPQPKPTTTSPKPPTTSTPKPPDPVFVIPSAIPGLPDLGIPGIPGIPGLGTPPPATQPTTQPTTRPKVPPIGMRLPIPGLRGTTNNATTTAATPATTAANTTASSPAASTSVTKPGTTAAVPGRVSARPSLSRRLR